MLTLTVISKDSMPILTSIGGLMVMAGVSMSSILIIAPIVGTDGPTIWINLSAIGIEGPIDSMSRFVTGKDGLMVPAFLFVVPALVFDTGVSHAGCATLALRPLTQIPPFTVALFSRNLTGVVGNFGRMGQDNEQTAGRFEICKIS